VERYIIVQTKLPEDTLKKLKEKSGEKTTKEALARAVEHYINCTHVEPPKKIIRKRRGGRFPVYLIELYEHYKEMSSEAEL